MPPALRSAPLLLAAMSAAATATAATAPATAATVPAPTPARTLVFHLKADRQALWSMSADGSRVVISESAGRVGWPRLEIVDTATGAIRRLELPHAQYSPPDGSLSGDGRLVAWTTAKRRHVRKGVDVIDPTTHVRDLDTGKVADYPHFDGNFDNGDGTALMGDRGPITWYDGGLRGANVRVPRASGLLQLATRRFSAIPGRSTKRHQRTLIDARYDGGALTWRESGHCKLLDAGSGKATDLGKCPEYSDATISNDGSTVFVDGRGWIDAHTGAPAGATIDWRIFDADTARDFLDGVGPGDLSRVLISCIPGRGDVMNSDDQFTVARRPYLLDRATGAFTPIGGPADAVADGFGGGPGGGGSFTTGTTLVTNDGTQLMWADGQNVWRISTAATGPAGPLPSDCLPS